MKRSTTGFTIVELLIVIVVIAILAAISVVAYTGIRDRASTSAIASEARVWRDLLAAYKAVNGSYPSPVASGNPLTSGGPGAHALDMYCLGTGFPQVGGTGYCSVRSATNSWRVAEPTGAYLMSQLSTIGKPPTNTPKYLYGTAGDILGPFLIYISDSNVQVMTVFPSGTSCASLGMLP